MSELASQEDVTAGPDPSAAPIQVRTITVQTGRLVCDIVIPDERFRRTTPGLAAFAAERFPDLPRHACVNAKGTAFGDVMELLTQGDGAAEAAVRDAIQKMAAATAGAIWM